MTPTEKRRLGWLFGVLALVAAYAFWPSGPEVSPSAAARARAASARSTESTKKGTTAKEIAPEQVPTAAPFGTGAFGSAETTRNIFIFAPPTKTRVPTPVPPTPTPLAMQGQPRFIGPMQPPPPPTPTPIIPPPITYKLVGLFGSSDKPIAAFEDGGRLINAREGDVLDGRFIVRKINKESVDFAFVGLPKDITRRIALGSEGAR